jgi:glutathione-regulated potassium-efflux system ancillary protein KefC
MDHVALVLVAALVAGATASLLRMPPMVGYLVAGFGLTAAGVAEPAALDVVADVGVALLLFGIGLKFDAGTLLRRQVWLPGTVALVAMAAVLTAFLALLGVAGSGLVADESLGELALLGLVLAFSSTVLAVTLLQERGAETSLVGRTAIGVLVVQDVAAVVLISVVHGRAPSPWALALVLLVPGAWVVGRLLPLLPRDDLRPLLGVVLALVPGYWLFDAVGLEGDLGALVVGVLVGAHPDSAGIAKSLIAPKDLLLVGFFLSIGFAGLPGGEELLLAAALLLVLPLKLVGFAWLLRICGLRRRTSTRTSMLLANYSEFALIAGVALTHDLLDERWLTVLGTTVALGMVLSSAAGRHADRLTGPLRRRLPASPDARLIPDDAPVDVGDAQVVVLGMGRVGQAAHEHLTEAYGQRVVGIEVDGERAQELQHQGLWVVHGDATDPDFWTRVCATGVDIAVLAMPFHGNNLTALELLRKGGFYGTVAFAAQRDQDLEEALTQGAHTGIQLYEGAGTDLAARAAEAAGLEVPDVRDA